jgi:hypothetical protein
MPEKMKALYRAKDGGFRHGVPARHLSQADFDALSDEEQQWVQDSGLYEVRSEAEMSGSDAAAAPSNEPAVEEAPKEGE